MQNEVTNDLLRVIVEEARDYAFIVLDRSGGIQRWNRGAELLFGHPAEEILGRHFSALFTIEDVHAGVPEKELERAVLEGRAEDQRWHARRDGTRFYADGVTTAVRWENGVAAFVKISRDATSLKHAEEERQRLLVREQQLNREKDDFFAAVSHELRTPLTAITGWLALLERDPDDRELVQDAIASVRQASETLTKLVDDLLDSIRARSGKMRVVTKPADLAEVAGAAIRAFRLPCQAKRLTVHEDLGTGVMVLCDETRMHQVISNLVSNAIRHSAEGGRIDIRLRTESDLAVFEVTDHGEGIDASLLPFVFEPFRQQRGAKVGLGLGLAIARSLMELHGGTIQAESPGPGQGSTFRIRLPLLPRGDGAQA
jgi:PAS domain S-box-containing protein